MPIEATPQKPLLGAVSDVLQALQGSMARSQDSAVEGNQPEKYVLLDALLGALKPFAGVAEKASYGEPLFSGGKATIAGGIDPDAAEVASNFAPVGKALTMAKALGGAAQATMLARPALIQLAKTDPHSVMRLEAARLASNAVTKAGGSTDEAWHAGSAHLHGTPYAGWHPAEGSFPQMFEVTDDKARLAQQVGKQTLHGDLGVVYRHPDLEKFLPDMPEWPMKIGQGLTSSGMYYPSTNKIEAFAPNRNELRSVLIHEGQHGAAETFGLPTGTNTDFEAKLLKKLYPEMTPTDIAEKSWQNYQNSPGEMLARMAEYRRLLTADQRRSLPPGADLDMQFMP